MSPAPDEHEQAAASDAKTNPPQDIDGLITWAATDASGLHMVTVWESQAHADRYAAEQLFPAFQEFGLTPDMMEMTTYDADEFYLRDSTRRVHGPGRAAPTLGGASAELVFLRQARFRDPQLGLAPESALGSLTF